MCVAFKITSNIGSFFNVEIYVRTLHTYAHLQTNTCTYKFETYTVYILSKWMKEMLCVKQKFLSLLI